MLVKVKQTGKIIEVVPMYNNNLLLKDIVSGDEYNWDAVDTRANTPVLGQSLNQESRIGIKVNIGVSASVVTTSI